MSRTQPSESLTYVSIRNISEENPKPRFFIEGREFASISGELFSIATESKKITPKTGKNAGREITIHNLLLGIEDDEGPMQLQVSLYSGPGRNAINSLAGPEPLGEIFLSVYNNDGGFRNMSVKKSKGKEDWYKPYYSFEEELEMVGTKKVKGEVKKDYDPLTDKYVAELIPIIERKIIERRHQIDAMATAGDKNFGEEGEDLGTQIEKEAEEASKPKTTEKKEEFNDDLPF